MPNLIVIFVSSLITAFLVTLLEIAIRRGIKMAKMGRPTEKPKKWQFRVRLTEEEKSLLSKTAENLDCSKSEVLIKGLYLVSESKKGKN